MALPAILAALQRAVTTLGGVAKNIGKSTGGQLLSDVKYGFTQNIGIRLSSQIGGMISGLDELEKVLLMNGTNLSKFNKDLGVDFKNLNVSTLVNLRNAANLYSIGFRENNKSLLKVANVFDLTGQNTQGLLSVLPNLAFNLKLTSQGVNELAITTLATGEKYGVATDKLIETIAKLPVFETAAVAGLKNFGTNLVDIVARMGALGPQVGKIVNALLTTEEGLRLSVAAGAGDLRRQLEQAKGPEEAFEILKEIFRKVDEFAGPVRDQMKALGESQIGAIMGSKLLEQAHGSLMMQMLGMGESIDSFTLKVNENAGNVDYTATLFAAVAELANEFLPLYEIAIHGLTGFTRYVTAFVQVFKERVLLVFNNVLAPLLKDYIVPIFEFIGNALIGVRDVIVSVYNAFVDIFNYIGDFFGLDKLGKMLADAIVTPIAYATGYQSMVDFAILTEQRKLGNDAKRTADAAERQKQLAEKHDRREDARDAKSSVGESTAFSSAFRIINRELMFAVTAMRIDERVSQQNSEEQINLLKMLVRNQSRGLSGDLTTPSKAGGL